MGSQLEQHVTVCRSQRVVKAVIDFVLATGVFVVDLLQLKTQLDQSAAHVFQIRRIAVDGLEVVRRFVQLVVRIGHLPGAVHLAQQKEFGLNTHPHAPAARFQLGHRRLEHLARASVQRLAARKTVAHGAGHTRHKRQHLQGLWLHAPVVLAAQAHAWQARTPDAGAGKTRAEFVDLNNDGVAEIVVANGHVIHHPAAAPYRQTPLLLSLTNGRFQRDLFPDNNYFGMSHLGRGLAVGDLNNDRRQDVVISHINEPVAVLINATEPARKPLRIRLIGTSANRDAIGARVVVQQGDDTRSYQIIGGGSYLSRSERIVSHTRTVASEDLMVTVYWPNATRPQATNVEAKLDQLTIIEEK